MAAQDEAEIRLEENLEQRPPEDQRQKVMNLTYRSSGNDEKSHC
jgi:hypothetical protein